MLSRSMNIADSKRLTNEGAKKMMQRVIGRKDAPACTGE